MLLSSNIHKLNLSQEQSYSVISAPRSLSAGIFQPDSSNVLSEAWGGHTENYYDRKLSRARWNKTKTYYNNFFRMPITGAICGYYSTICWANSTHRTEGFSSFGDDENIALKNTTMETGIIFNM